MGQQTWAAHQIGHELQLSQRLVKHIDAQAMQPDALLDCNRSKKAVHVHLLCSGSFADRDAFRAANLLNHRWLQPNCIWFVVNASVAGT